MQRFHLSLRHAGWIALVAFAAGCGARAPSGAGVTTAAASAPAARKSQFPSREKVTALGDGAPTPTLADADARVVAAWTLTGPLPPIAGDALIVPEAPIEKKLAALVDGGAGHAPTSGHGVTSRAHLISRAMQCTARELGQFFLLHGAMPPVRLERFIAGACGAPNDRVDARWLSGEVPPDATAHTLPESWQSSVDDIVAEGFPAGPHAIGGWVGVVAGRAVVLVVSTSRAALVTPVGRRPASPGVVTVEGMVFTRFASLEALVTQGSHGYADCLLDEAVELPRFRALCPTVPDDREARIDIAGFEPGRVLGRQLLSIVVWPSGEPVNQYAPARAPVAATDPVDMTVALSSRILGAVNARRVAAGHVALTIASEQSAIAQSLVGPYFAAVLGQAPEIEADQIALGLLAGWEVPEMVAEGRFTSTTFDHSDDVGALVSEMLERPSARRTLFDEAARFAAVGAIGTRDPDGLAAVMTTYRPVRLDAAAADAERVFARIAATRGGRTTRRSKAVEEGAAVLTDGLISGKLAPSAAIQKLLEAMSHSTHRAVQGWVWIGSDLDNLDLPQTVLADGELEVAVVVGYTRRPDHPWGLVVVLIAHPAVEGKVASL